MILSAMLTTGCLAENDPEILYVTAARLINRVQKCSIKSATGQVEVMPVGTMDLLQTNKFLLFPVVENGLVSAEEVTGVSPATLSGEPNNITITGAWVSFDFDSLDLQGSYQFTVDADNNGVADILELDLDGDGEPDISLDDLVPPGKIFVPAAGYAAVGEAATLSLEIIPPPIGNLLDQDLAFDEVYSAGILQTKIVIQGFLSDGTEVKSNPFFFPVKICRGCLVSYDIQPASCCFPEEQPQLVPCFPGQDESSSCTIACSVLYGADRSTKKVAMLKRYITNLQDEIPAEFQETAE